MEPSNFLLITKQISLKVTRYVVEMLGRCFKCFWLLLDVFTFQSRNHNIYWNAKGV